MCEVGTLKELNVKPGDVVQHIESLKRYIISDQCKRLIHASGFSHAYDGWDIYKCFRIISRAVNPKLWRDMTPEEKGALLLAHHDGKVIENKSKYHDWTATTPYWDDNYAYRIRPEPKVEVVTMDGSDIRFIGFIKGYRITFNTIDGKPDCASIKMEAI